jgi:hypothetical protein
MIPTEIYELARAIAIAEGNEPFFDPDDEMSRFDEYIKLAYEINNQLKMVGLMVGSST